MNVSVLVKCFMKHETLVSWFPTSLYYPGPYCTLVYWFPTVLKYPGSLIYSCILVPNCTLVSRFSTLF